MTDKSFELLARLSDGQTHSGESLAHALSITRGAVWNRVQRLQARGVDIFAVTGKGYRLAQPYEFLNAEIIRARLQPETAARLAEVACVTETDSTNQRLLERIPRARVHACALFAEYQTAGRGRRGDVWIAPPGSGLCGSLGWRFDAPPPTMSALSLAIGVAVANTAATCGAGGVQLKWPNDVLLDGRKLAGILIEMRAEYGGPSTVVIGIGLNTAIPAAVRAKITQPVADLSEALGAAPSRNTLAATLLDHVVDTLARFAADGFAPFVPAWQRYDGLVGRAVQLELPDRKVIGTARGVDAGGMLVIEHHGQHEKFLSGHVRLADAA